MFRQIGWGLIRCGEAFTADLDASSLGELGESFVLRGAFDGGSTQLTKSQPTKADKAAVKQAAAVKTQLAKFPLKEPTSPVRLEVRYDGRLMTVETRNGKAFLPSPNEEQQVEMTIVRGSGVQGTLGVVLRVNGENTLGRQTVSDLECRKWLLTQTTRKRSSADIRSTAISRSIHCAFRRRIEAASYRLRRHVGQIQVTVFKEVDKSPNDLPPGSRAKMKKT